MASAGPYATPHCMQVCTSLQIDKHASTRPRSFLQAGCPTCHPTNRVKALYIGCKTIVVSIVFLDRCNDLESAGTAFKALHGWWFDGRLVTVKYLREQRYEERYLDSHCANSAILPSNNSRLSLSQPFHSSVIENS